MLVKLKPEVKADFVFTVENRVTYYACTIHPLSITTYGATKEKAEERAVMAIHLWAKAYPDADALLVALDNRGVSVVLD